MQDNFVHVPQKFFKKLIEKGDKIVLYSSFGPMRYELSKSPSMNDRTNNELINKTMMGEKLGTAYKSYPDPDMYGMCYDYYAIALNMFKLPSELLDDNLLKFISTANDRPEILHFNICKLHFNEDGDYSIC